VRKLSRKEWPYQILTEVKFNNDRADPKVKWLWEQHGVKHNDLWTFVPVGPFNMVYCFKREEDYTMFCLRWA